MSSGFGLNGSTGSCFKRFNDVLTCANENGTKNGACINSALDYLECIHGTKKTMAREAILKQKEINEENQ